ncbi:Concanavalin A-like lectin/glucanase, subgroup [Beauveria brongniartii RCEF 3172]|uniref:Concanavalin A-like lectin/glucanase, subgroup n=1 Tax=Beauveria brongniartii RCEF 3172 TaxID=1081107 RepID=A0A162KEX9_9HYPO|nr:Concanavalin A-like lectin/glucanase, subgroup [Beauveria brongniartii RCEF 3172]
MASLFSMAAATSAETVQDSSCDCFLSNGTNPGYYAKHAFFDFRQLSQHAGVPNVVENAASAAFAPESSDFFTSDAWTSFWEVENWNNSNGAASNGRANTLSNDATVYMINSPSNIYIAKAADDDGGGGGRDAVTFLTMRTRRLQNFQTAAEFQTADAGYHFLSLRMRARTVGAPGAVTAMFTYRGAANPARVQEADVEILTPVGPAWGPGEIAEATRNATLPGGAAWSDWAVHRLDWTPERSVWYVDGREAASIAFQVPRDPAAVNFNAWSDGGSWSGNMTVGDEASLQIQWIEMLYNSTDAGKQSAAVAASESRTGNDRRLMRRSAKHHACKVVCTIDDVADVGKAALLSNSTESGAASITRAAAGAGSFFMSLWAIAAILYIVL